MFSFVKPLWEIEDEDEDDQESSCSSFDSDYEAMFSNAPLLQISLADLQKLSEESQQPFENSDCSSLSPEEESQVEAAQRVPKKGTTPEQILASILEDVRKDELEEKKSTKKTCVKMTLPPFRGTRALREEEECRGEGKKIQKLDQRAMDETLSRRRSVERGEIGESSGEDGENDASGSLKPVPNQPEEGAVVRERGKVAPSAHRSNVSATEDDEEEDDQGGKQASFHLLFKPKEDVEQQRKDNIRRLAAIQQRQKETEEHKKVVQSALANLVSIKRRKI